MTSWKFGLTVRTYPIACAATPCRRTAAHSGRGLVLRGIRLLAGEPFLEKLLLLVAGVATGNARLRAPQGDRHDGTSSTR